MRNSDHIDTSKGTVHLVIGGGGHVDPLKTSVCSFPDPPGARVLMSVRPTSMPRPGRRRRGYMSREARTVVGVFRDRDNPMRLCSRSTWTQGSRAANTSMGPPT